MIQNLSQNSSRTRYLFTSPPLPLLVSCAPSNFLPLLLYRCLFHVHSLLFYLSLGQSQWSFMESFMILNIINFVSMASREEAGVLWHAKKIHHHEIQLTQLAIFQSI